MKKTMENGKNEWNSCRDVPLYFFCPFQICLMHLDNLDTFSDLSSFFGGLSVRLRISFLFGFGIRKWRSSGFPTMSGMRPCIGSLLGVIVLSHWEGKSRIKSV
jgi:hypothetical protein